jgi:hypothetical protein
MIMILMVFSHIISVVTEVIYCEWFKAITTSRFIDLNKVSQEMLSTMKSNNCCSFTLKRFHSEKG